jgi:hypothetical protein
MKRNEKAGLIAIIGGFLMLVAGLTGAATWEKLGDLAAEVMGNDSLNLVFQILVLIGALGGLVVILGGILLQGKSPGAGKILIAIGAGMGLIGLMIFIILAMMSADPGGNIVGAIGIGFVGVILTIIARAQAE